MKQTELDVTKVMVLLQRRYNDIREIHKLTKELAEALARNDDVSTSMILQMRAEEMEIIARMRFGSLEKMTGRRRKSCASLSYQNQGKMPGKTWRKKRFLKSGGRPRP